MILIIVFFTIERRKLPFIEISIVIQEVTAYYAVKKLPFID
ncbi:hypothetical protein [Tenacibaculum litopenaei]